MSRRVFRILVVMMFTMISSGNADEILTEEKKSEILEELSNYNKLLKRLEGATGAPNSRFWYKKGTCEYRLKMNKKALRSFEKSIAVASDLGDQKTNADSLWKVLAMFGSIHCFEKSGDNEKVEARIVELQKFLKEHPLKNEKWVIKKMKKVKLSEE